MTDESTLEQRAMEVFSDALEQPETERMSWLKAQCDGDQALEDRVAALLSADSDGTMLRTGGVVADFSDDPIPERIGAYRIIELVGRGGMGAVYKGQRDSGDFDHIVAVKVVQPGALSEELIERFERERQILARLNHPNIARLFDGGTLEDDSPYFVMEYVDGKPITDWADEQELSLNDRLSLYKDVCAAVQHAHQNLIVHRDITPTNILVTEDGAVKLIDFGIARPHDTKEQLQETENAATLPSASLSFTPGYAAPERASSASANTLSDIYSLGKLLEALVILHQPGKDLHSIILKAKSHNPLDRYPSVDSLLEDLQKFTEGRAVEARDGGFGYMASKFVSRYKFPIAAGVTSILALMVAAVVMTFLFFRAEEAEQEASQRFDDVRSLARTVLYDVYTDIEDLPGATSARRELVQAAQVYLENLAADKRASPDLILETGQGFTELGRIMGSPSRSAFEDDAAAKKYYDEALKLLKPLDEQGAADPGILYALGDLYYGMGELAVGEDGTSAKEHFETAHSYLTRGLSIEPNDSKSSIRLLATRVSLAEALYRDDEHEKSQAALLNIISEVQATDYLENQKLEKLLLLNRAYRSLGISTLNNPETRAEAIVHYDNASLNIDEAVKLSPKSNKLNIEKAKSYRDNAFAYYMNERHGDSVMRYQNAIDIIEKVVEFDTEDQQSALLLIYYKGEITAPLSSLSRFEEAEVLLLDVLDAYEKRLAEEPDNAGRMRNLWVHNYFVASHYKLREDDIRSCKHIDEMARFVEMMETADALRELDKNNWQGVIKDEYKMCF